MSDRRFVFVSKTGTTSLDPPFDPEALIEDWASLRSTMIRTRSDLFSRDEWAYLISFLEPTALWSFYESAFGKRTDDSMPANFLASPKGTVAAWMPGNVSLLGPLVLIAISLTGNRLRIKGGSTGVDLAGAFLGFILDNVTSGPLRSWMTDAVEYAMFDRNDKRNLAWAKSADVRIAFGADQSVANIHALPNPEDSVGFSFTDRRSEAWIEPRAIDDELCRTLIKVFAIYGQAGCTSPAKVVLLDSDVAEALKFRDRLAALWPNVIWARVETASASNNIMAAQLAAAKQWNAVLVDNSAAVLAVREHDSDLIEENLTLCIVPASIDSALSGLPENIQTVGAAFCDPDDPKWRNVFEGTRVLRVVPVARMHHFEPVWDGQEYFKGAFSIREANDDPQA